MQSVRLLEEADIKEDTNEFRVRIRACLTERLQKESDVLVLTEFGSRSFGSAHDNLSDMDFQCIVSEKINETSEKRKERSKKLFSAIKDTLNTHCAPIDLEYESLWECDMFQMFYRFQSSAEFRIAPTLLIDFCIMYEAKDWERFSTPEQHGVSVILFDKENLLSPSPPAFDTHAHTLRLQRDLNNAISKFSMFQCFVGKEVARNHFLGAWHYYHQLTLTPLLLVLHMQHEPLRYSFGLRYTHHFGYSKEMEEKLQNLYFLASPSELLEKQQLAIELFFETVGKLSEQNMEPRIEELARKTRDEALEAYKASIRSVSCRK